MIYFRFSGWHPLYDSHASMWFFAGLALGMLLLHFLRSDWNRMGLLFLAVLSGIIIGGYFSWFASAINQSNFALDECVKHQLEWQKKMGF